jgi:ribosomal-protein-alanine N-acetyltransferase
MTVPELTTARLTLSIPPPEAAESLAAYYARNAAFHKPWRPTRTPAAPSVADCARQLRDARSDFEAGRSLRLAIVRRDDPHTIIGTAGFSEIVRGPFQACFLGYGLDERCEGQGYMIEALGAAIECAFSDLKLHRIMANYQPINERSGRLLRRLGFMVEGYARDYLNIDGAWRDHVLTSLTNGAFDAVQQ